MDELEQRARRILLAIVTEFIARGEPVGSRTIARRYRVAVSSATVRAEMAALTRAGYLAQPHTSAGRVPTDAGFRAFVDTLVSTRQIDRQAQRMLERRYAALRGRARPRVDALMRETGRMLSELTGAAAVVLPPNLDSAPLEQLRFVPLSDGRLLSILVSSAGVVENKIVRVDPIPDAAELDRIHNFLQPLLQGRSLRELRDRLAAELADDRTRYDSLRRRALLLGRDALDAEPTEPAATEPAVQIWGQERLIDRPEFAEIGKLRALMHALDQKSALVVLLDRTLDARGVQVVIGSESHVAGMSEVSVVSARWGRQGEPQGALGVIGPTRMDYGRVVPVVGEAARQVSRILEETP